jgi:hypothetical protein
MLGRSLVSEDWLILSENETFMPLSFFRSDWPFFRPEGALNTFQPVGLQAGGVTPDTQKEE